MSDSQDSTAIVPDSNPLSELEPDHVGHMRRRLFRTLDQPDRSMVAIDCGSISEADLRQMVDYFLNNASFRESQNLVLAVPTSDSFSNSPAFDVIQSVKHAAFENGYDGKVSWLLMQEPSIELAALKTLVARQGGKWLSGA